MSIFAPFFLILLVLCVLLNFLTLPGNWLMAILVGAWALLVPNNPFDFWFFFVFFALLVLGEVLEFVLQIKTSKKAGASGTSNVLGIIGAIIGAIVCVPLFLGLGAIAGALGGAWLGCFIGERLIERRSQEHAIQAANAALWGKFLGIVIKFGIGFYLIFHTANSLL